MAKKPERDLLVGLDIGTSKVVAIVAELTPDKQIEIIGVGSHVSKGLRRGVVVNIESTVLAIQRAVEEAELMAGCEIHSVYTGIAGSHINSLNSHGIVAIENNEVSQRDIERVLDAAKAVAVPADQRILHVLPQEYLIDKQEGIRVPLGMTGVRLEAKVHMVTGAVNAAENIVKCVQRCGLQVNDIILEQLASSYAVLTEDEKELGVCLIDIGGGTTDIAIFADGAIAHTAVIPIAGDQVTNDIAVALHTASHDAELIKMRHGCAMLDMANSNEMIEIPGQTERGGRKISSKMLADVIHARYEELFTLVAHEIRRSGFEELIPAGIVLTGGASTVRGGVGLAEKTFGRLPIRIGSPRQVVGLPEVVQNPIFATAVGLLQYGKAQQLSGQRPYFAYTQAGFKSLFSRMRDWFSGNF